MAEKGGKGFSLSNSKGKKVSTGKSGKETNLSSKQSKKKVHFSSSSDSDSDEPHSPIPTPSSTKGGKSNGGIDYGKGGKPIGGGDKAGGVSSAAKPTQKVPDIPNFNIESDLPKNTKCMMDCEAKESLEKIQEHLVILSEDPTIKLPELFHKGLNYAKSSGGYTDVEEVRRVLEVLKRKNNVSDSEICLIANICPEGSDEVFALMPELKAKRKKTERAIEDVLGDLIQLKSNKD
ncbi:hypothetical protein ACHQM5_006181 [Ranunculus cassubicifolius]